MKHFFLITMLISLLYRVDHVHAQSDSEPELSGRAEEAVDESQSQQRQEPKPQEAEKSNTKPPKKVFKPTEEISEDRPVPFPVDI